MLKADIPVVFRATQHLEDTLFPLDYWSQQRSFVELTKSCQQWELSFLSTKAYRATKILLLLRANISVTFRVT